MHRPPRRARVAGAASAVAFGADDRRAAVGAAGTGAGEAIRQRRVVNAAPSALPRLGGRQLELGRDVTAALPAPSRAAAAGFEQIVEQPRDVDILRGQLAETARVESQTVVAGA